MKTFKELVEEVTDFSKYSHRAIVKSTGDNHVPWGIGFGKSEAEDDMSDNLDKHFDKKNSAAQLSGMKHYRITKDAYHRIASSEDRTKVPGLKYNHQAKTIEI